MSVARLDTLKVVDRLEAAGFTPEQACTLSSVFGGSAARAGTGTHAKLPGAVVDLQAEIRGMQHDVALAACDFRASLQRVEQRIIVRFGGMLVVAVGVLLAALRYLPRSPH